MFSKIHTISISCAVFGDSQHKISFDRIRYPHAGRDVCVNDLNNAGAQLRLNGLKSLAKLFNFVVFQSVTIFSILKHPCSFIFCYNLFGVFLSL